MPYLQKAGLFQVHVENVFWVGAGINQVVDRKLCQCTFPAAANAGNCDDLAQWQVRDQFLKFVSMNKGWPVSSNDYPVLISKNSRSDRAGKCYI